MKQTRQRVQSGICNWILFPWSFYAIFCMKRKVLSIQEIHEGRTLYGEVDQCFASRKYLQSGKWRGRTMDIVPESWLKLRLQRQCGNKCGVCWESEGSIFRSLFVKYVFGSQTFSSICMPEKNPSNGIVNDSFINRMSKLADNAEMSLVVLSRTFQTLNNDAGVAYHWWTHYMFCTVLYTVNDVPTYREVSYCESFTR